MALDGAKARIWLDEAADFKNPKRGDEVTAEWAKNGRMVGAKFDGLEADTEYFYAVEVDGEVDTRRHGRFRTFKEGPWSFKLVFGSCATGGSESTVFDAIRENKPAVFMHIGDFHYENISRDDPDEFRNAYGEVLASVHAVGAVPQRPDHVHVGRPRLRPERLRSHEPGEASRAQGVPGNGSALRARRW